MDIQTPQTAVLKHPIFNSVWCAARLVGIAHHSFYSVFQVRTRSLRKFLVFITRENASLAPLTRLTRKMVSITGRASSLLEIFCMYTVKNGVYSIYSMGVPQGVKEGVKFYPSIHV